MAPRETEMLPFSPACERNRGPILSQLRTAFAPARHVLEIGSGTGQHAVYFAAGLPHLTWQPSDVAGNLDALRARLGLEAPGNVLPPLELDVHAPRWDVAGCDGVFTANTLHIVDWPGVEGFFARVGETLPSGGTLCIYGPFRYGDRHTSESNAAFDAELRARDPASGVRDFEAILRLAGAQQLAMVVDHAMPANNRLMQFRKVR
ncbi:MAG: DUF938 domain-containing protein [Steroidobacteraceae bacterium]|nr:DUF938 domain-containing protein [Steroidobacteraceae bacterium]